MTSPFDLRPETSNCGGETGSLLYHTPVVRGVSAEMNDSLHDVLVVEDDPEINELMGCYVELAGYFRRSALTGQDALRKIETRCPVLIVLDLMLPDIPGLEICRRLQGDPRRAGIPHCHRHCSRSRRFPPGSRGAGRRRVHHQALRARAAHGSRKTMGTQPATRLSGLGPEAVFMSDRRTILVVDDEIDIVRSVKEPARRDYRVLTTTSPKEGLEILERRTSRSSCPTSGCPRWPGPSSFIAAVMRVRHDPTAFYRILDLGAVIEAINEGRIWRYVNKPGPEGTDHHHSRGGRALGAPDRTQESPRELEGRNAE